MSQKRNSYFSFANARREKTQSSGFTLIELVVSVGLFAIVMTLVSGSYLMMIGLNRQAQSLATGIDNLSFALETMARTIRTGSAYCGQASNCPDASTISFRSATGATSYSLGTQAGANGVGTVGAIVDGSGAILTDPSTDITSLLFKVSGAAPASASDYAQSYVTIIVSGKVSLGAGKAPQSFTVETGATMLGSDL